jgi:S1-C subfamily serine protease
MYPNDMRRMKKFVIAAACAASALGGVALSFPIQADGCVYSATHPLSSSGFICTGSGVYIGHGFVLTNHHVAEPLSEESSFLVPAWKYLWKNADAGVQEVVFLDRDIEVGLVKLRPSVLSLARVDTRCLSLDPVKRGETLRVTSDAYGQYPPVAATLTVIDDQPLMRLDRDPRDSQPYAAMTILTILSADQAKRVGPGSSGSAVLNRHGEIVGLVWTGRPLADGSMEVWITPVSSWLSKLKEAKTEKEDLQILLDARCARTVVEIHPMSKVRTARPNPDLPKRIFSEGGSPRRPAR